MTRQYAHPCPNDPSDSVTTVSSLTLSPPPPQRPQAHRKIYLMPLGPVLFVSARRLLSALCSRPWAVLDGRLPRTAAEAGVLQTLD
eukprot:1661365-Alexandrium_andersonii.AAC.1